MGYKGNIIYISSISWNFSWHRQQEMMDYLAKHNFRVLFVEPCDKKHPFSHFLKQEKVNIWRLRPRGLPYERCLSSINKLNSLISRKEIIAAANLLGFQETIVWLDRVHGFDYDYFKANSFTIYDLVDEILSFGRVRNKRMLISIENKVLQEADLLLSSSQTLMERKIRQSKRKERSLFLPNGVNCDRFKDVASYTHNRQVTLGFVGHISKRRINFALVKQIALLRSEWKIEFIGPGAESDKIELEKLASNIEVKEPVDGDEIPKVIGRFDVGVIPYNIEKADMDYVFPRKALEYLAAGKSVVSTPLKEVERLCPYVLVANNPVDFVEKVEQALKTDISPLQKRKFAQKYDWEVLMGELVNDLSTKQKKGENG